MKLTQHLQYTSNLQSFRSSYVPKAVNIGRNISTLFFTREDSGDVKDDFINKVLDYSSTKFSEKLLTQMF